MTTFSSPISGSDISQHVDDLKVFLVEDSFEVREIVTEVLQEIPGIRFAGFAEDEAQAYASITMHPFDVLILDLELKEGNGMSLLRSLARLDQPVRATKIIFSNNSSAAYRRAGEQYGVQHFFDKTTQFDQLRECLAELGAKR